MLTISYSPNQPFQNMGSGGSTHTLLTARGIVLYTIISAFKLGPFETAEHKELRVFKIGSDTLSATGAT